ncbi:MAG: hypothetical protein QME96_02330 [Myxococcota bacterium]|nr:hypothetical protein [Myxococcota bacterium]
MIASFAQVRSIAVTLGVLAVASASVAAGDTGGDPGRAGEPRRFLIPPLPFYQETSAEGGFRMFFPLYFERWTDVPQRDHSLGVLPFYWRWRGPDDLHETDVVAGLYWRFRRPDRFTDVIGPFYASRTADGTDVGLPPLFMAGSGPDGDYQIVGLWFWRFASEESSFVLAPPFYGYRRPGLLRYGVPPLVFGGETGADGYSIFLPMFWHFYNTETEASTTVVPPLFVDIDDNGDWSAGIAPVLFFGGGEDSAHFTLAPLVHLSSGPGRFRLITPLGWRRRDAESDGWGALLYHQDERGPEWFRTLAPLWFAWGDDSTGTRADILLNMYHRTDPVGSDWVVFPFWWDFHDLDRHRTFGLLPFFMHDTSLHEDRRTTWVFPTFEYSEWPQTGAEPPGWSFNLHPILYVGRDGESTHQVVFPFWWSFSDQQDRTTIGFPLWWDFEDKAAQTRFFTVFPLVWRSADPDGSFTLAANSIYTTRRNQDGTEGWSFHFLPLFDVGRERPGDIEWSILFGLAGYQRRGSYERIRILWLPFEL